jgi:hypothetical protein
MEGTMAQRRIGQEGFRFGARAERQTSLDELGALIDWSNAECKQPERTRNADLQNHPSAKPVTTTPSHRSAGDLQSATILKCLPNHTRRRPTKCHPRALISNHFCTTGGRERITPSQGAGLVF